MAVGEEGILWGAKYVPKGAGVGAAVCLNEGVVSSSGGASVGTTICFGEGAGSALGSAGFGVAS